MTTTGTAEDLAAERARASFDPAEVEALLRGGARAVEARHRLLARIAADPLLGTGRLDDHFLSRAERFKLGCARMRRVFELGLTREEGFAELRLFREGGALDKNGAFGLHTGMFIPTLELLGTDAQRAEWLPRARSCAIIGTYAQTELGHGTNLAGLETTAEYDARTQEFVLHTPTKTATKWWPGGLGKSSTHAVVMARLTTPDGVGRGQQSFVVQLRDLRTHLPLPGIELGDIGPKFGYGNVDNGYLILDRVRVPRAHMLARFSCVEPDGSFSTTADNPKAVYGTMLHVRVYLVEEASLALAHATTIAARYSAVRRQGGGGGGGAHGAERAVIDYQTQQARLLPLIAGAYAVHFAAAAVRRRYDRFRETSDLRLLPELHATSSALKSHCTGLAARGVETCRLLCGGHGYSMASGLPSLYMEFTPSQTYEGDNVVLLLQCARWMVKQLAHGAAGGGEHGGGDGGRSGSGAARAGASGALIDPDSELEDVGAYLRRAGAAPSEASEPLALAPAELATEPRALLGLLREVARVRAIRAAAELARHSAGGGEARAAEVAWSERASVELAAAASAHARYVLALCFHCAVARAHAEAVASRAALAALAAARDLHLLSAADDPDVGRTLLESGRVRAEHTHAVRTRLGELLARVRRDAVALVDAFGLTDLELNSALGRADGDVYGALLDWARRSPLNRAHVVEGFEEHIRPIMGACSL